MDNRKSDRAAKVFELFLSDNDNESDAAYERLCEMRVGMNDVAIHIEGNIWETKLTHKRFEVSEDGPVLLCA